MFDCCSKDDGRVDFRADLTRAFALVGLLRLVDDSVPDDLVYVYMDNTDVSGLGWYIKDRIMSWYDGDSGGNGAVSSALDAAYGLKRPTRVIPTGLINMAKEYFARCYWDQIRYITDNILSGMYGPNQIDADLVEREMVYPSYVRNALNACNLPYHASIQMAKHPIDVLHSTIMPTGGNIGEETPNYSHRAFKGDYDVLTREQLRKVNNLREHLQGYISSMISLGKLPNPADRDTFCNLLDILILLTAKRTRGYDENRRFKQAYEYSKLAATLEVGGCRAKYPRSVGVWKQDWVYNMKVDRAVEDFANMSPQAVLCLGKNYRFLGEVNSSGEAKRLAFSKSWMDSRFRSYLKKANPRPATEVRLYVKEELCLERRKLRELIRMQGPVRRSNHQYSSPFDDEGCCCPPAPEEPCCCG